MCYICYFQLPDIVNLSIGKCSFEKLAASSVLMIEKTFNT